MKIFIYGDDNAVGIKPNADDILRKNIELYDESCKWTSMIGESCDEIIKNAVVGRTILGNNVANKSADKTIIDDLWRSFNGDISKIKNVDLFIIMLGTNDFKIENRTSIIDVVSHLNGVIKTIKLCCPEGKIMVVSPPRIIEGTLVTDFYYKGGTLRSAGYNFRCFNLCYNNGYIYVNGFNAEVGEDGERLSLSGHKYIAEKVNKAILKLKQNNNAEEME